MNNMSQIMKQAKVMQDKMAEMQKKIEEQEVEGSSGGGVVKVQINGKNEIKSLKIDPTLINSDEVEVLEDLLIAAVNDAILPVSKSIIPSFIINDFLKKFLILLEKI